MRGRSQRPDFYRKKNIDELKDFYDRCTFRMLSCDMQQCNKILDDIKNYLKIDAAVAADNSE